MDLATLSSHLVPCAPSLMLKPHAPYCRYYQISTGKMQWTVPDEFKEAWQPQTLAYE